LTPICKQFFYRKDYVAFEQGVNPIIAEKLTSERSREYMTARRVAKEYEASTRGLNKLATCVPPIGTGEEMKQVYFTI
jgi:cleavage stimulation factor subunit 3